MDLIGVSNITVIIVCKSLSKVITHGIFEDPVAGTASAAPSRLCLTSGDAKTLLDWALSKAMA